MVDPHLVIADQPAGLDEPAKGTLHDPASWEHFEAFGDIAPLDDLKIDLPVPRQVCDLSFEGTGVPAIGPDFLQPAVTAGQWRKQQARPIPVLHVGGRHLQRQQVSQRVYQDVSLSSCNFLTRIKATKSGLASCPNALAVEDRSSRGFFLPCLSRARSRRA
jgi:hypothetical protein